MDKDAFDLLHRELFAMGYRGGKKELGRLLQDAEDSTRERELLAGLQSSGNAAKGAFLKGVFAHARRRGLRVVHADLSIGSVTLTSRREDRGIRLGRLELTELDVRCVFYRGNELIRDHYITW